MTHVRLTDVNEKERVTEISQVFSILFFFLIFSLSLAISFFPRQPREAKEKREKLIFSTTKFLAFFYCVEYNNKEKPYSPRVITRFRDKIKENQCLNLLCYTFIRNL
jgi:hypothetical protein